MKIETRKYSTGQIYYSIVYFDGHKKIRLKQSEHPKFSSIDEAKSWADSKAAQFDCMKARAQKRLEWKTKYYNFSKLADQYEINCKKEQPNSWRNTSFFLHHYVFHFFLDIKNANNPNLWPMYFQDFKDWLEDKALTITTPRKVISYSSKNHCIKTLNTFLTFLISKGQADPSSIYKMKGFEKSKLNSRDADALITKDEFNTIYGRLLSINELSAIFYQTCYFTGMRFNEVMGLSMDNLYPGMIQDDVLHRSLTKDNIQYYGYIVLESQPKHKTIKRNPDGSVDRKPLKSKKSIHEKNNRIIPIIDKNLFNNLVKLYKNQQELRSKRVYGDNPKNYLLFDGLFTTRAVVDLRKAYEATKYSAKGYHCCRHTRATELVGQTLSFVLAKYWLGHSRQETTDRYTHIFQQSTRQAINKIKVLEFV